MIVNMYKLLIQQLLSEMELFSAFKSGLTGAESLSAMIRSVREILFHH